MHRLRLHVTYYTSNSHTSKQTKRKEKEKIVTATWPQHCAQPAHRARLDEVGWYEHEHASHLWWRILSLHATLLIAVERKVLRNLSNHEVRGCAGCMHVALVNKSFKIFVLSQFFIRNSLDETRYPGTR